MALNVNSSASGVTSSVGDLDTMTDQVGQQQAQFSGLLKDPGFNGQSEMGSMLKLQRAIAQEQMVYQTVSNVMKARTDSAKNAISNMR
jgi:hypothetical protein